MTQTGIRYRTRAPLLALSAGIVLALAGCSGAGLTSIAPVTADPAYSPSAAAVPSGSTSSNAAVAVATAPSPTAAVVPLAGADFVRSGFMDHRLIQLRFDVLTLVRQGRLVELTARITNLEAVPSQSDDSTSLSWGMDGLSDTSRSKQLVAVSGIGVAYSGTTLVDVAAKKRYLVAVDSRGTCLCTPELAHNYVVGPGESRTLNATYAAPPATTTTVTVDVPGIGSFADVPIS